MSALSMGTGRRGFATGGPAAAGQPVPPLANGAQTADDDSAAAVSAPLQAGAADPDAANKMRMMDQAQRKLDALGVMAAAGMANPTWNRPGATSIPQLAAAGAMLAPTRTGGFAESLGAGFTAGAQATEAQRRLEAENQMRLAQLADTAAYREGILGVRGQHEENYGKGIDVRQQMANTAQQRADDALRIATMRALNSANNEGKGKWSFAGVGQDGLPIIINANTGELRSGNMVIGAKPGEQLRADVARDNLTLRQEAYQASRDDKERALVEHSTDADLSRATSIMNADRANGGKMTLHDALSQVQAERPNAGIAPTRLPAAPAPGGTAPAAPAAPAAPKAPAASVIPPRPPGVPPGSQYSPSRNAWRDPDGKVYPGGAQ